MESSPELVMELRRLSGEKVLKCKKALEICNNDVDKALEWLRQQEGPKTKLFNRPTSEGLLHSYIHNGQICVVVELLCETDFVSRNEEFKEFAHNLCLHIAACDPTSITREEINDITVAETLEIFSGQIKDKPVEITGKIVQGKLDKWFSERVLLEQPFVKDNNYTIEQLLKQKVSKFGENIRIRRFLRWTLGEKIQEEVN